MFHRYLYGSFAEYSEDCVRANRRGHLINARVVEIWRGNKEKNPFAFEPNIHSAPSCEVRKVSVVTKQTLLQIRDIIDS